MITAALAAPLAGLPVYGIYLYFTVTGELGPWLSSIIVFVLVITFAASVFIGIPVYYALARRARDSFTTCGTLGAAAGLLVTGLVTIGLFAAFSPGMLAIGTLTGADIGLAFRFVARRQ